MKKVSIFIFFLIFSIQAYDFKTFKYTPNNRVKSGFQIYSKAITDQKNFTEKLKNYLTKIYLKKGDELAKETIKNNEELGDFKLNLNGFSWEFNYGPTLIRVERSFSPDLFSDSGYIVNDHFIITVQAEKYLEDLIAENIVDLESTDLSAYAGLGYRVDWNYIHKEEGIKKAILSDFSKLFLSFTIFDDLNFNAMEKEEFIKKEEQILFNAEASATIPLKYGLQLKGSLLVEKNKLFSASIHSLGTEDQNENESVRIFIERANSFKTVMNVSLISDFYNLVKVNLFRTKYSHQKTESKKIALSFSQEEIEDFSQKEEKIKLSKLFNNELYETNELFPDNIKNYEESLKKSTSTSAKLLIYALGKVSESEKVVFSDKTSSHYFYKINTVNETTKDNILTTFFNAISTAIANVNIFDTTDYLRSKELSLEYDSGTIDRSPANFDLAPENLSLKMRQQLFTKNVKGLLKHKEKKELISFMKNISSVDSKIIKMIEKDELIGPFDVNIHYYLDSAGLQYFKGHDLTDGMKIILNVCKVRRSGTNTCYDKLSYAFYKLFYNQNKNFPLMQLKDFAQVLSRYMTKKEQLELFFGKTNIFVKGVIKANLKNKTSFTTTFYDGTFSGLGIIDNYRRLQGVATPLDN